MPQTNMLLISRFIGFSLFGIFVFFVPLTIAERTTILLDHCVLLLTSTLPIIGQTCMYMLIFCGGLQPFTNQSWHGNTLEAILAILKFCAIPISLAHLIGVGPDFLMADDMAPFLLEKLVMPVGLIIPIGAIFLSFLVGYGLLEFIGVLMEPIMRPLWRIPGRSAIDAIASFAGSYSIGLLITDKVYRDGGYSLREAAVIATGFSTVSASFMVIVARTLDFIDQWLLFFWSTLAITFLVTALSVRIWPLCVLDNKHKRDETDNIDINLRRRFKHALDIGLQTTHQAPTIVNNIKTNFRDGLGMSISVTPSLLSIGLLGLLIVKYTPLFDWIGYLFLPAIYLTFLPEPLITSTAVATGFAEMFLPALTTTDAMDKTRYVVGVTSITSILFLSASIPCIMATSIKIPLRYLAIIWFQRAFLSILFAASVAHVIF